MCLPLGRIRVVVCMLALSLGVLGGCVTHAPLSDHYAGPKALPEELAERFGYAHGPIDNDSALFKRRAGFAVKEVTFPSNFDVGGLIRVEYYDPEGVRATPVVVLLPILNGHLFVTRYFARYFAQRGYAAVVVDRDRRVLGGDLDRPELEIRRNVIEYKHVLDWVAQNPEFEPEHIGLFGISLGGMDAVMLAALDERVDAVVAAMAGGDLSYVLMNSDYGAVNRAVSSLLEATGLDREGLEAHLEQRIRTDPLRLAPYVDAEEVLLVLTRSDTIVPFKKQQELRTTMGEPEALYLPTGHRSSVIFFPRLRSSAYEFFARRFD